MGDLVCLGGLPKGGNIGTIAVGLGAGDVYIQTVGDLLDDGKYPRLSGTCGSGGQPSGPFYDTIESL